MAIATMRVTKTPLEAIPGKRGGSIAVSAIV
jgi:hypothetical protein